MHSIAFEFRHDKAVSIVNADNFDEAMQWFKSINRFAWTLEKPNESDGERVVTVNDYLTTFDVIVTELETGGENCDAAAND